MSGPKVLAGLSQVGDNDDHLPLNDRNYRNVHKLSAEGPQMLHCQELFQKKSNKSSKKILQKTQP